MHTPKEQWNKTTTQITEHRLWRKKINTSSGYWHVIWVTRPPTFNSIQFNKLLLFFFSSIEYSAKFSDLQQSCPFFSQLLCNSIITMLSSLFFSYVAVSIRPVGNGNIQLHGDGSIHLVGNGNRVRWATWATQLRCGQFRGKKVLAPSKYPLNVCIAPVVWSFFIDYCTAIRDT